MRKKIILVAAALVAGLLLYFATQEGAPSSANTSDSKKLAIKAQPEPQQTNQATIYTPTFSSADKVLMDKKKLSEYQAWRRTRGYAEDNNKSNYDSYNGDTLNTLMEQNDIFATQTLAKRQYEKEREGKLDFIKTKALYYRSAVLGSTFALSELASMDKQLAHIYRDISPALAYKYSFDAQIWVEAQKMRGDTFSSTMGEKAFSVEFGKIEMDEIREEAKTVYEDLANQRQKRNLDNFDNSPSEWEAATLEKINSNTSQTQ